MKWKSELGSSRSVFRLLFVVALAGLVVLYIANQPDAINALQSFSAWGLLLALFGYAVFFFLNAIIYLVSFGWRGYKRQWLTVYGISNLASLSGYLLPARFLGIGVRGYLSVKLLGMDLKHFVSAFSLVALFSLLAGLVMLLLQLGVDQPLTALLPEIHFVWYFLLASIITLLVLFYAFFAHRLQNIPYLKRFISWFSFHGDQILGVFLCSIVQVVIQGAVFYLLMKDVGAGLSFSTALLICTVGHLSMLFSITPANIGIKEAVFAMMGTVIAADPSILVAVVFVDRILQLLVLGISSLFCWQLNLFKVNDRQVA